MSAGRESEGAGCITWWGFSPASDLLSAGPVRHERDVNVLLVGSGDPRHILKTVAGLPKEQNLHVWVMENSMELVARQMLLLYLALMPQETVGISEKTEVFLELFGNGEIRSQTEETLRRVASQLCLAVIESLDAPTHACLNTNLLKFRERDQLIDIFKFWTTSSSERPAPMSMRRAWDYRVRQHLGTRYDSKQGCFDWDLTMKLHSKGCDLINKRQYKQWRERGLAFEMREGVYETTNLTLLSWRIFNQRGVKKSVRGYWGDIVSSPYLSYGIDTTDNSLLKKENGQFVKTAQDISIANVQELFHSLSSRRGCPTASRPPAEPEEPDQEPATVFGLMHLDGVSVTFLPVDSLMTLAVKRKYFQFFHNIYFSASCVHQLGPWIGQIAAPDAALVVELAKYILDLNKEQEAGFEKTVTRKAAEAGFKPYREGKSDSVHAVFRQQQK